MRTKFGGGLLPGKGIAGGNKEYLADELGENAVWSACEAGTIFKAGILQSTTDETSTACCVACDLVPSSTIPWLRSDGSRMSTAESTGEVVSMFGSCSTAAASDSQLC